MRAERASMKALVKAKARARACGCEEQPKPEIGPDDVLVKVHKTGICGTDIHIFNWDEWAQTHDPDADDVGHEYAGEIAELGANVRGLKIGQRVSGEGHVIGMDSRAARGGRFHLDPETRGIGVNIPGAFAEYRARCRPSTSCRCPTTSTTNSARSSIRSATPSTPRSPFDLVGEDVLITGAGPIGIMAAAVARHVGARHVVITDINPLRLDARGRSRRRHAGRRVAGRISRDVMGAARHGGGLRRRPRDERRAGGLRSDGRSHGDRRPHRDARHAGQADAWSTGTRSSSSS